MEKLAYIRLYKHRLYQQMLNTTDLASEEINPSLDDRLYQEYLGLLLPGFNYNRNSTEKWHYKNNAIQLGYELTDTFIVNTAIQVVLSLLSVILNCVVIIVSLKASRRRSRADVALSHYTRVSLSFADILCAVCTFCSVLLLSFQRKQRMTMRTWNLVAVLTLFQTFFTTTSFYHLILMSVRR